MTPGRTIFVNRVYAPDEAATAQLLHDLAPGIAALQRRVTVITIGDAALPLRECSRGVEILRIPLRLRRGAGLARRALHSAACWWKLVRRVGREARPGDTVVALTDPPLLGVGVAAVVRGRARVYHWCQDIYPEVAMAVAGPGWRRRLLGRLRGVRDASWREAAGCVVLGEDMRALLLARGIPEHRITICPNWAPIGTRPVDGSFVRSQWKLADRLVVAYSGNLGRVHALQPLLEVAHRLHRDGRITFVMVGDGPQRRVLADEAARRGLTNVAFHPPQPRLRLSEVLAAGDVHVIGLRPECLGTVWPSKFYGIVAAHRPILFIGPPDAEVARLVREHGLGGAFAPGDVDGMVEFLTGLARNPAERIALGARVGEFERTLPGVAGALDTWLRLLASPPATVPAAS